jgi:Na+/melibiose symporter-like transporter
MTFTALLLHNPQFRRLWIAQVVSQLGDWFNAVAVYALLLDLTNSATLVAAMMVVQLLPLALVGPIAGVVVDRMSRRTLMIGADLARAVLFTGLIFVRSADQIWLAFVLVSLGVVATAFFEPARTAMLPDVVPREHLITANALWAGTRPSSATDCRSWPRRWRCAGCTYTSRTTPCTRRARTSACVMDSTTCGPIRPPSPS